MAKRTFFAADDRLGVAISRCHLKPLAIALSASLAAHASAQQVTANWLNPVSGLWTERNPYASQKFTNDLILLYK